MVDMSKWRAVPSKSMLAKQQQVRQNNNDVDKMSNHRAGIFGHHAVYAKVRSLPSLQDIKAELAAAYRDANTAIHVNNLFNLIALVREQAERNVPGAKEQFLRIFEAVAPATKPQYYNFLRGQRLTPNTVLAATDPKTETYFASRTKLSALINTNRDALRKYDDEKEVAQQQLQAIKPTAPRR